MSMGSKSIYISDLSAKDRVNTSFLIKTKRLSTARDGKPFLMLNLMDRSGEIEARLWSDAEAFDSQFDEGDVVSILGKVSEYQHRRQLVVEHMVAMDSETVDLAHYVPSSNQDPDVLYENLLELFRGLENPWVRKLGLALLEDPEIGERYRVCPAAKTIHHAFRGGLLAHSLQVIRLVDAVVPLYEDLDRDVLVFGAAFHDFGKIYELYYSKEFGYTDAGKLVGHITIGVTLIDRKIQQIENFPKELEHQLKHIVLSHHGRLDYGSPKRPATLEAQVLSQLDDLDSKINSIQTLLRNDRNGSRWTSLHKAYNQYYFKTANYRN